MEQEKLFMALAYANWVVTFVGRKFKSFLVTMTATERYVEITVFGRENASENLEVVQKAIEQNKIPFDYKEKREINGGEFKVLEYTWNIK